MHINISLFESFHIYFHTIMEIFDLIKMQDDPSKQIFCAKKMDFTKNWKNDTLVLTGYFLLPKLWDFLVINVWLIDFCGPVLWSNECFFCIGEKICKFDKRKNFFFDISSFILMQHVLSQQVSNKFNSSSLAHF